MCLKKISSCLRIIHIQSHKTASLGTYTVKYKKYNFLKEVVFVMYIYNALKRQRKT